MDSKVDYLLKNNRIEYVVQVQKKIKGDIERKKDDLRALIGKLILNFKCYSSSAYRERYNELLEATQSMEDMKCSVDVVINSLKDLHHILLSDFGNDDSFACQAKIDPEILISEILLDLPLKIWNLLYTENVYEATFYYFSGIYAYKRLETKHSKSNILCDPMHRFNRMTVEDMNTNIVIKGWNLIENKLKCSKIDENDICAILLSLMILKQCNLYQISDELYSRQTSALKTTVNSGNSKEFQEILNIFHNTIICSRLFEKHPNNEFSVQNAFNELLQMSDLSILNAGQQELKEYFDFSFKQHFEEMAPDFTNSPNSIERWFESSQEIIKVSLQKAQRNVSTIKDLYREIKETEGVLIEESRFAEWKEIDLFDIQESIWKGCILNSFQERIYEIVDGRTSNISEQISNTLTSETKNFKVSDSTIVNSVWNHQKSKGNKILDSCSRTQSLLDEEFDDLADELKVLEKDFHNILVHVCERIGKFISILQEKIPRSEDSKGFILFGALLFRDIHKQCTGLSKILAFSDKAFQDFVQKQSFDICCAFYNDWFEHRICILLENFDKTSYCELQSFFKNLTVWDKITIQAENFQQSILEIPLQMSLSTYDLFIQVSEDINRFSVHSLPKSVLIRIFSLLGKQFLIITKESLDSIKSNSLPSSVKQTMALQLYFDLLFLKSLFSSSKVDSLRKEVISSISDQLVSLESLIDPFDLHLMVPYMKSNADKLNRSCGLLLAFLRADKLEGRFKSSKQQESSNQNEPAITNTMWLH